MSPGRERHSALVIGAGAAGLGVAAELERRGIAAPILEREALGSSWRRRYPTLTLNNDRWSARLPRARMRAARWPNRDEYIAYLERYAEERELQIRCGIDVRSIERSGTGWLLATSKGDLWAQAVVVCCGHDRLPHIPDWPGAERFAGELLHAADYQSPAPFAERDVLIVGVGTSGTEIAVRLAGVAKRVRVAVRGVPNFMPAEFLGVPITVWAGLLQGAPAGAVDRLGRLVQRLALRDLTRLGLGPPPRGVAEELSTRGMGPVIDRGFLDAVRSGEVELVGGLRRFDGPAVELLDGSELRPDAVIAATGYRSGLEDLVGGLRVLSGDRPDAPALTCPRSAPGLYFHGYRLPLSGELAGIRRDSHRIARAIARSS